MRITCCRFKLLVVLSSEWSPSPRLVQASGHLGFISFMFARSSVDLSGEPRNLGGSGPARFMSKTPQAHGFH